MRPRTLSPSTREGVGEGGSDVKVYNSFLVRCWSLSDADRLVSERFSVEHFQTGERSRPGNLDQVRQWITDACACSGDVRSTSPEAVDAPDGAEAENGART